MRTNGRPWSRVLYGLSKYYSPLYEKLREGQLIPDDLVDAALSTLLPSKNPLRHRDYFLYSLNDTFILDFSQRKPRFIVIIEQAVEPLPFFQVFFDARKDCLVLPYTGPYTILSILLHLLFS